MEVPFTEQTEEIMEMVLDQSFKIRTSVDPLSQLLVSMKICLTYLNDE